MKKTFLVPMSEPEAKQYCEGKNIEVGIVNSEVWEQADKTKSHDVWNYTEQSTLEVKLAAILLENDKHLLNKLLESGEQATIYQFKVGSDYAYEIECYTQKKGGYYPLYREYACSAGLVDLSLDITQEFLNKLNKL